MLIRKINMLFRNLQLRYKLMVSFTLICFVSLLMFSLITITIYKDIIVKKESTSILENIASYKATLDQYLEEIDRSSVRLVYSRDAMEVLRSDPEGLPAEKRMQLFLGLNDKIRETVNNTFGIKGIYILDNYKNIFSLDSDDDFVSLILTDENSINQKWYKDTLEQNGATYWTIVNWYSGTENIALMREIVNIQNGDMLGICVITLKPGLLDKPLLGSNMKDGVYSVVDQDGQIYSEKKFENLNEIIDINEIGNAGSYYTKRIENIDYVVTNIGDQLTGWSFVHVVEKSSLFKEMGIINRVWLVIFLLSLAAVTAISFLIARTISNPLYKLISLIKEVEKGNLKVEFISLYKDEIGVLGRSFNKMVKNIREGIPLKREKFLRAILESNLEKEEYEMAREAIDIPFTKDSFQVVVFNTDEAVSEQTSRKIENKIVDFERTGGNIVSITLKNGQYCVISNDSQEETYKVTQKIVEAVRESLCIDIKAFLGNNYNELFMIKNSYEDAKTLMKYKFFSSSSSIYLSNDLHTIGSWQSAYPDNFENRLMYHIEERNIEACENVIREVKEFFRKNSTDPFIISLFISNVYINIYKVTTKNGILPVHVFGNDCWEAINLKHATGAINESFADLASAIRAFFAQIKNLSGVKDNLSTNIRKALDIMEREYCNPDISIEYIAKKIYINPNYFSQLFSKEMGESFTDYLGKIRVEKAKKLLSRPDGKIKDISCAVGISDPHYFGIWFKELTGLSPSQYRKQ